MADFKVLLDDLGIETSSGWCIGSRVRVTDPKGRVSKYGAVSVIPLSTDSTASGAIKGAAWGVFLGGGLGAAVGSMVGGGMKVAFELHTLEGAVLRCIAGRNAYLDIKNQVETKPAQPKPPVTTGPRRISPRLLLATAILPFPLGLGFWRRGYTGRARALAAVWTLVWFVGIGNLPAPTEDPAGVVQQAARPEATREEDERAVAASAAASNGAPDVEKMNDPMEQELWISRTQRAVREQMRDPDSVRFRRTSFKVFRDQLPMVCGEVSADNALGGRTGFQRFIASGETFGPVLEELMSPSEFCQNLEPDLRLGTLQIGRGGTGARAFLPVSRRPLAPIAHTSLNIADGEGKELADAIDLVVVTSIWKRHHFPA